MSSDSEEYEPSKVEVNDSVRVHVAEAGVETEANNNRCTVSGDSNAGMFVAAEKTEDVSPRLIRLNGGIKGRVTAVCLSPRGNILCTGGEDGQLCMWDFDHPPESRRVAPTRVLTPFVNRISGFQSIVCIHAAIDGSYFVACQNGDRPALVGPGGAQMGYCAMGERGVMDAVQCKGHRAPVTDSSAHRTDSTKFFTCSQDGTIRQWDARTFTVRSSYAVKHGSGQLDDTHVVESVCGTLGACGGKGFASGGADGKVQLWDTRAKYRPGGAVITWNLYSEGNAVNRIGRVFFDEKHVGGVAEAGDGSPFLVARVGEGMHWLDLRQPGKGCGGVTAPIPISSLPSCNDTMRVVRGSNPRSFLTGTSAHGFRNIVGGHVVEASYAASPSTSVQETTALPNSFEVSAWCAGRPDEDVTDIAVLEADAGSAIFAGLSSGVVAVWQPTGVARAHCLFSKWWDRRPIPHTTESSYRMVGQKAPREAVDDFLLF